MFNFFPPLSNQNRTLLITLHFSISNILLYLQITSTKQTGKQYMSSFVAWNFLFLGDNFSNFHKFYAIILCISWPVI